MDNHTPATDHPIPPKFDPEDYRAELNGMGFTRSQEDQLLEALWHIMVSFVDLGFGMDSVSLALNSICGEGEDAFPQDGKAVLSSDTPTSCNIINKNNLSFDLKKETTEES